tara:strand:- start:172 stop:483 length:312 start_codon:yes stop_codon:yes gene_type:complete
MRLNNLMSEGFDNPKKVRKWFLGIHQIYSFIQEKNFWSKEQAWDKLKIELINNVGSNNLILDDLEWVKGILVDHIEPSTDECLRVSQRYPNQTPLLDALRKFV